MIRFFVLIKNKIINKIANYIIRKKHRLLWKVLLKWLLNMKGISTTTEDLMCVYNILIKNKGKIIGLSSTGCINALGHDEFYKVSLNYCCAKRLLREYHNWEKLKSSYLKEHIISNMTIYKYGNIFVLSMPIVSKIKDLDLEHYINKLFIVVKGQSETKKNIMTKDMQTGIDLIRKYGGGSDILLHKTKEEYLPSWLNSNGLIGFTHGDLHNGNIMLERGVPIIIDLDRISFEGNQLFDIIHFEISNYLSQYNNWCDCLIELNDQTISKHYKDFSDSINICLAKYMYALDRVGKEYGDDRILKFVDIEYIKYVRKTLDKINCFNSQI